jgi:hypothetical protein
MSASISSSILTSSFSGWLDRSYSSVTQFSKIFSTCLWSTIIRLCEASMPMIWIPWLFSNLDRSSSSALSHNILFFEIPWSLHLFCQYIPPWLWYGSFQFVLSLPKFLLPFHCWNSSIYFFHIFYWSGNSKVNCCKWTLFSLFIAWCFC